MNLGPRRSLATLLLSTALACAVSTATPAQVVRKAVTVQRPDMPRVAADMAMDAAARREFVTMVIAERLSPRLVSLRGEAVNVALQPADELVSGFRVISRDDTPTGVRVVCEADVDLPAVVFRLVSAKVLTFGAEPPRILLVPGVGTSVEAVKSIRARLRPTLASAGLELPAIEEVAPGFVPRATTSSQGIAAMIRQVASLKVDFVASITLAAEPAPAPNGGVVLDAALQFAVVRSRDNRMVAEHILKTRGSGATRTLAMEAVLDELGPAMARALGGQLAAAVFASGDVIDPDAATRRTTTIDVYASPTAASTAGLINLLRRHDLAVSLSNSRASRGIRNRVGDTAFAARGLSPSDRLIVEGNATVSDLHQWLTTKNFGATASLSASVIEYGDDYIGLEIVDANAPAPRPPLVSAPPPAPPPVIRLASDGPRPPLQLRKKIL